MIEVLPYNETYVRVTSDDLGILKQIAESYTFKVPGYKFMPAYKTGRWDGSIKLFSPQKRLLYKGLVESIEKWSEKHGYSIVVDSSLKEKYEIDLENIKKFIISLNIPDIDAYDYQEEAVVNAISSKRQIILSPTGSGKSLMIYILCRYFDVKTLVIVPRIGLVNQLESDFQEYGYKGEIHKIYSGKDKYSDKQFTVTTWQSIQRLKKDWLEPYEMIIVDEVHNATADKLKGIMETATSCELRYGFTGTLDDVETDWLVLSGLFGPPKRAAWTHELIERDILSELDVKMIVFHYDKFKKEIMKNASYQDEITYIVTDEKRNRFIANLALKIKGNTVIITRFPNKQGKEIYDMLEGRDNVYFYAGGTDVDEREEIRKIMESKQNAIIVASMGCFGEGVNIKNLQNLIFASPSKKRIKNLQAIGRILRKNKGEIATVYDLADNYQLEGGKANHTLRHFKYRVQTYKEEKFKFKIHNLTLGGKNG